MKSKTFAGGCVYTTETNNLRICLDDGQSLTMTMEMAAALPSIINKFVCSTSSPDDFSIDLPEELVAHFSESIDSLQLTVRASNCLKSENIFTVGAALGYSDEELLAFPNVGKKCLEELVDTFDKYLSKYNLTHREVSDKVRQKRLALEKLGIL